MDFFQYTNFMALKQERPKYLDKTDKKAKRGLPLKNYALFVAS
jgi:hypothetical protein